MPTSATGTEVPLRRAGGERGFTLVELMVVMVIIALVASAAVMTMPDPRGRLVDGAESFAARARGAQQTAIIESRDMALWVSPAGYGFERFADGAWAPVTEPPFEDRAWPEGTEAVAAPRSESGRTRIVFDSTGLNEPLNVTLAREGDRIGVAIGADGTIRVGG